ncbi:MAG: hypothetical protein LLG00_12810, partial [Planctomycetaceae bacterium]|nr:hypothetical protein [Planctomycetaceae bacterium]
MYKNFLLAAVALLVTAGQVTAAIDTFQGAYPYNYNDAANWSNGHLPDSTVDALIANGGGDSTVVLSDYL